MDLTKRDLISMESLTPDEITRVLETADRMKEVLTRDIRKVPTLRGKTVMNLFFESSTRTRTSFEIAGKRLSADVVNFSSSASSLSKSETLADTARNLAAMMPDIVVIRHAQSGAPYRLSKMIDAPVVNAGDGAHEHPTQALLDLFTVREHKKHFEGLKVAIIGDITHSRVARSDIYGFTKLGAEVVVAGPPTLIPIGIERLGVKTAGDIREAITDSDVIIMLRIQLERQSGQYFPNLREYARFFGLNRENLRLAKEDAIVMHPGPINRGVEISTDVADGPQSVILDQVTNGVAVRMAVLYLLTRRWEGQEEAA